MSTFYMHESTVCIKTRVHPLEFFRKSTVVKSGKEKRSQDDGFNYPHQAREDSNEDIVEKHEVCKDEEEPPVIHG